MRVTCCPLLSVCPRRRLGLRCLGGRPRLSARKNWPAGTRRQPWRVPARSRPVRLPPAATWPAATGATVASSPCSGRPTLGRPLPPLRKLSCSGADTLLLFFGSDGHHCRFKTRRPVGDQRLTPESRLHAARNFMSCLRQLARMMLVWRIAKAHKLCAALFLGVGSSSLAGYQELVPFGPGGVLQ